MQALLRINVAFTLYLCLTATVNTSETDEINSNESSPDTLQSNEEVFIDTKASLSNGESSSNDDEVSQDVQERRRRLQFIQHDLAAKLKKALVKKLMNPKYSQRINATSVEKYFNEHVNDDLNVASGRRSFNDVNNNESNEVIPLHTDEEVGDDDGRRKFMKKVTYVIDEQPNLSHHQAETFVHLGNDDNHHNSQTFNQATSGTRTGYSVVTQNKNGIIKTIPYQTSFDYVNHDRNQMSRVTSWPNYYLYRQPFLDMSNPLKMYYTYNYPMNRYVKFTTNNFFDYGNHVYAQNDQIDFQRVAAYLTMLMNADKYVNPRVVNVLKGANELDFAEINKLDQSQLVQLDKSDLEYLRKYIILILNRYGMTPYVFRLMEYVNLVEGRPKNEIYLVFKILSNQQAVYGLNKLEADQLKAHLQYLLNEYGRSPHILPFVKHIGGIQFQTNAKNRLYFLDFGDFDPSSHLSKDYMTRIYLHLYQIYNGNQNILNVLSNINRIYNGAAAVTQLDLQDYQNLSYLNQNDLYLLAKYVSQIKRQRGDHKYLDNLLVYIHKLQTLDKGIIIIKDGQNLAKGVDLTGLYGILLDINNKKGLSPEILVILNRLRNKKIVALNDTEQITNDLKVIKEYLIQHQIYEYDPLLIKILYELNDVKHEEVPLPIEEDSQKWVNIKVHDLELIYQFLLQDGRFSNSPYLLHFVNEILPLIKRAKLNPYENVVYKFRYSDIQQLYNILQPFEKEQGNPIYVMIMHYLDRGTDDKKKYDNGTIPEANLLVLKEFFGDNKINLDVIYKFLLYEIESGHSNSLLFELLQFIKQTLQLPNGELKIDVINLNDTNPIRHVDAQDLQKLYLYLQKLIEDKILSTELIEFYEKNKQKNKQNIEIFYNSTNESLNRIRNLILTIIKERGENPYVLEILFDLNHILEIPENDRTQYVINGTHSEVNDDDVTSLIKYFSQIKAPDDKNLIMVLEYLRDTKERIKNDENKPGQWIYINAQDLEKIYQYLLGKEKFLHSPYLALFVNDILPIIQRAKLNPYENVIYKFRYNDLLELYNLILSEDNDKENPIYIKILHYLDLDQDDSKKNNGTISNIDFYVLNDYFGGKQINLNVIYKFLVHEIDSGNRNKVLVELLQLIRNTLLLPNGQLKVNILNLNGSEPNGEVHPKDLQKLYFYLQKLIEDKIVSLELSDYMKKYKQKEKLMYDILSDVDQESLIRLRNYLLILINELGENRFVLDLLFEINSLLGIPDGYDKHTHVLNGTRYEPNNEDLELLKKYFSETNVHHENTDLIRILNYIRETQKIIKNKEENPNVKWISINVQDLEQIYQYLLGKEKFISSPYLVTFVNEVLPFIQRAKLNPNENTVYKFRHSDLLQLFNLIEKDKSNPIYIKMVHYLDQNKNDNVDKNNGTTPNVDLLVLKQYFGDQQINLNVVYKFLIQEMESGNQNKLLIELLQLLKRTLLLPNGQLKIQTINLNGTDPTGKINPKDLQKIYLNLFKLVEDKSIGIKLLVFVKKYREQEKHKKEVFNNATKDTLNRVRNFLLLLIKERGENPYILEILFEINKILRIPESEERDVHVLNGTQSDVNDSDLKLLIKYFSEVKASDVDTDLLEIIEYLHDTQEKLKNKEQRIYMNALDLQEIYRYLLGNEDFINSPYLVMFVNEVLPFIHKAKQRTYENLLYKFRYLDLLHIYNLFVSQEKDKRNPIYIKILQYLDEFNDDVNINNNGTTPKVDLKVLNEYFGDEKINLDIVYKFLIHEIASGSHDRVLLGLLHLIQEKLLFPNGRLKINMIHLNGTQLSGLVHPNDLQKLYLYLQKLIEDDIVSLELLDYMKKYKQKEKQMQDKLSDLDQESLNRVRNYLLILIKELDENPFVLDLLFKVNEILGVPKIYDQRPHTLNGTDELNEKDLEILINYFTDINIYGKNSDLINILDYLYEVKGKSKQEKENPKEQWVSLNVHELELIYQYLSDKEKFSNSPYLEFFVNEILPLIQRAKEHPNEIVIYKFRYPDLMNIYNYIASHENDKGNPLFIKILFYLEHATNNFTNYDNGTKPNDDLNTIKKYFGDNKINLDVIYKYLVHETLSGNQNKMLLELLQLIERTLLLPNGQLKVINLNDTEPNKQIHPKDLKEIYLYLQKLLKDNIISNDLLKFNKKLKQEHEQKLQILSNATKESLNRVRNFVLILIKDHGENPLVLDVLFEINGILGLNETDDKTYHFNYTNQDVDENDLELLIKYVSVTKVPNDIYVRKIIDTIHKNQKRIEEENERKKKSKSFKLYILEIINNNNINPDIKQILEPYLEIGIDRLNHTEDTPELDLKERKVILKLSQSDLNVLFEYLQDLINKFGPIYRVEQLLRYIEKVNEKYKKDNIIIHINTTHPNDTQNIVNVTRNNLDVLNRYLLELINVYGESSDIIHIIYKMNNVNGRPGEENDWMKLMTNNTSDVGILKLDEVNEFIKYLVRLIEKQGATTRLIKILRDFSKLTKEPIEDKSRKISNFNGTHTLVVLDKDDVSRIRSYLMKIIDDYGTNPLLMDILRVISPRGKGQYHNDVHKYSKTNIYTFAKLNKNDLNQLTRYIFQLIDKNGARPEFVEVLYLVYQICDDLAHGRKEKKKQYVLEISKEIKKLRDGNIIETMRNMDKETLITMYIDMLENIYNSPNTKDNNFSTIMARLLEMYKKEESPIKKYIILKWYEFLIQNKGVSYKVLRNPDFINGLLELDDNNEKDKEIIVTTENYSTVKPYNYNSDIDKILSELIDNTLRNKSPINDSLEDNNDTTDKKSSHELRDRMNEVIVEGKSCGESNKNFKDIWKVLDNIKKIHRHDFDLTGNDFERIFDIIAIFVNQLKLEKRKSKIPTSVLIDELEYRLLSHNNECRKQSSTVKELISIVVEQLRDIISYLKANNFKKDEIMVIVKSTLEEDIMPDINAISVQECTAAANKEILDALLTAVYSKTYNKRDSVGKLSTD